MTDAPVRPTSPPAIITVAPPCEVTAQGAVAGGWILTQLDQAAGLAGRKCAGGTALILRIAELTFHAPLRAGEEFVLHADLARLGNTSFNLSVSGWAEPAGDARPIITADVLMVAVDSAGKPRKIDPDPAPHEA